MLRAWCQPGVFSARLGLLLKENPASIRLAVFQEESVTDFSIFFLYLNKKIVKFSALLDQNLETSVSEANASITL